MLIAVGMLGGASAAEPEPLRVQVTDPRAFGHQPGDVVSRTVVLDVPYRLSLAAGSLPSPGRVGQSLELRALVHHTRFTLRGRRHTLRLTYQLFLAPAQPRVLDLPSFTLRFDGEPRAETWRIDFAPITVAPLAAVEASPRNGLGELRPDIPSPSVDTAPVRWRLALYALLALAPVGYLIAVYVGWPWSRRRQRPFSRAQRRLQGLALDAPDASWLAAWRTLHAALDRSAGQVVHAETVDLFIARRPRFGALRDDLNRFFARSQALFFGGQAPQLQDRRWLRDFCRRCVAVERGSA